MGKSFNHGNRELGNKFRKKLEKLQDVVTQPNVYLNDDEVERLAFDYTTRAPGDYVISGPIAGGSSGRGVQFASADAAEDHYKAIYGARVKGRISDAEKGGRWALLMSPKIG